MKKAIINTKIPLIVVLLSLTLLFISLLNSEGLARNMESGLSLVLEAQPTKGRPINDEVMSELVKVLKSRLDGLGVSDYIVKRAGTNKVVMELPEVKNPENAVNTLGYIAQLEFVEAEWAPTGVSILSPSKVEKIYGIGARLAKFEVKQGDRIIKSKPIILKDTLLTGGDVKGAWPSVDEYGNPVVDIEFNAKGAGMFATATERSIGRPIAILLDGKIISAPNVREAIPSGKAQISGNFTIEEVQDLVVLIRGGALPVPVKVTKINVKSYQKKISSIEFIKRGLLSLLVLGLLIGPILSIWLVGTILVAIWAYKLCRNIVLCIIGCIFLSPLIVAIYYLIVGSSIKCQYCKGNMSKDATVCSHCGREAVK